MRKRHYVRLAGGILLVGVSRDANPQRSPADDLAKLTELRESGALSEEEFCLAGLAPRLKQISLLGLGDGTFAAAVDYPAGILPFSVALGDLDGG